VEAIRALRRWAAIGPAELVALLRDDSATVTCQAATTLLPRAAELDPHPLLALLRPDNPPHVRLAGYRLLTAGTTWQRLATNLRLVDDRMRGYGPPPARTGPPGWSVTPRPPTVARAGTRRSSWTS